MTTSSIIDERRVTTATTRGVPSARRPARRPELVQQADQVPGVAGCGLLELVGQDQHVAGRGRPAARRPTGRPPPGSSREPLGQARGPVQPVRLARPPGRGRQDRAGQQRLRASVPGSVRMVAMVRPARRSRGSSRRAPATTCRCRTVRSGRSATARGPAHEVAGELLAPRKAPACSSRNGSSPRYGDSSPASAAPRSGCASTRSRAGIRSRGVPVAPVRGHHHADHAADRGTDHTGAPLKPGWMPAVCGADSICSQPPACRSRNSAATQRPGSARPSGKPSTRTGSPQRAGVTVSRDGRTPAGAATRRTAMSPRRPAGSGSSRSPSRWRCRRPAETPPRSRPRASPPSRRAARAAARPRARRSPPARTVTRNPHRATCPDGPRRRAIAEAGAPSSVTGPPAVRHRW